MHYTHQVSLAQAASLAKQIGKGLVGGEILALVGPLGSGKTTFTKSLAQTLHVQDDVTSPTFVIMNQYHGWIMDNKKRKKIFLYHLDLYRTGSNKEVIALGLQELWGKSDTIVVIEWAEKIASLLPKKNITIRFTHE
jgi:tRNA threonylcarbamoyladenosine biosynthesis protein TsaE